MLEHVAASRILHCNPQIVRREEHLSELHAHAGLESCSAVGTAQAERKAALPLRRTIKRAWSNTGGGGGGGVGGGQRKRSSGGGPEGVSVEKGGGGALKRGVIQCGCKGKRGGWLLKTGPRGASGGAMRYLDDVRVQQVAVVDELTLDVLRDFAASLHELDGDLLARSAVHSKLHLAIAARVDVLQHSVLGLCAKRVVLGHRSV